MYERKFDLAIRDEVRQQRAKLKGKGFKAYVSYFLTYYLWQTIGIAAVLAFLIALIVTILNAKSAALSIIFLNARYDTTADTTVYDSLIENFSEYAGIDTDKESIDLDMSAYMTPGVVNDSYDMATSEKIAVHATTKDLDAVVADASNFRFYSYSNAFVDLRSVLSDEQIEEYRDSIYYIDLADLKRYQEQLQSADLADNLMTVEEGKESELAENFVRPDPEKMEDPAPVGVIVTNASYIRNSGIYDGREAVMGFSVNSPHPEAAVKFLEYLFKE